MTLAEKLSAAFKRTPRPDWSDLQREPPPLPPGNRVDEYEVETPDGRRFQAAIDSAGNWKIYRRSNDGVLFPMYLELREGTRYRGDVPPPMPALAPAPEPYWRDALDDPPAPIFGNEIREYAFRFEDGTLGRMFWVSNFWCSEINVPQLGDHLPIRPVAYEAKRGQQWLYDPNVAK